MFCDREAYRAALEKDRKESTQHEELRKKNAEVDKELKDVKAVAEKFDKIEIRSRRSEKMQAQRDYNRYFVKSSMPIYPLEFAIKSGNPQIV